MLLLSERMNNIQVHTKMEPFERVIEIVIENQVKIMNEVLDTKRRVINMENNVNTQKSNDETFFENTKKQKALLQIQIDKIEESINLLDIKLEEMRAVNDDNNQAFTKSRKNNRAAAKQCKFDRTGFCKMREWCPFYHSEEVCENHVVFGVCSKLNCWRRHPHTCHTFELSECKWGKMCRYIHKEQMFDMILKYERRNKAEDDDGGTLNESQVTVTVNDIHECDECTAEDTCVSCIMAKAKAFELDESVIDEEE